MAMENQGPIQKILVDEDGHKFWGGGMWSGGLGKALGSRVPEEINLQNEEQTVTSYY